MTFKTWDTGLFLRDSWQKTPLLIRNPWTRWDNPLDPDDLAGLACEDGVESRLITGDQGRWSVEHGAFSTSRFTKTARDPWTLLVQAVDHHIPEVAALIDAFRFVPDWRIDDVMVSYATDGGGVGAHFDQYDVFLIQGAGQRRWQIGQTCDADTALLPHDDLRLLRDFTPLEEWILEPGDILYVPPRVAHNGVAVGDGCMTYSIGFRAPARGELIAHWCDHLLAGINDDDRYGDPDLRPQSNPGEISAEAIGALQAMIADTLLDRSEFARWFGQYSSAPKYPEIDWRPDEAVTVAELRDLAGQPLRLERNPASRFSFIRQDGGTILLFVDGQSFACADEAAALAEAICARGDPVAEPGMLASEAALELLATLYNQGSLTVAD